MEPLRLIERLRHRLRALLHRSRFERDVDEEMRIHLEMEVEDRIRSGMTPTEARRTALRDFGQVDGHKQDARAAIGLRVWDEAGRGLRISARSLIRSPAFTITAVLSLAVGMGFNAAFFSVIEALLLRPLPVHAPDELVLLARDPAQPTSRFTYPEYERIRDHEQTLAGVTAFGGGRIASFRALGGSGAEAAEVARVHLVSGTYFGVLGVPPAAGRVFTADEGERDPDASPYAVLSHRFWQHRFGGDPAVVGRQVRLNSTAFTVIGVAAADFDGAEVGAAPDLFVPLSMETRVSSVPPTRWNAPDRAWLTVVGRRPPGVPDARIAADASARLAEVVREVAPAIAAARASGMLGAHEKLPDPRAVVLPGGRGTSGLREQASRPLFLLWAGAGIVLLIACANVAGLSLARALSRERETATRLALGATSGRLVRQSIAEGLLLSLAAGVVGLALAFAGAHLLMGLLPTGGAPPALDLSPNPRILVFSAVVSLSAALLCGLLPALRVSRSDLVPTLKRGGTDAGRSGRRRVDSRRALVVAQIALSLVLLVGAGLFARTLRNLRTVDLGFSPERVLQVQVQPNQLGYAEGPRLRVYYRQLRERIATIPGVSAVSVADETPLQGQRQWTDDIAVGGGEGTAVHRILDLNAVGPGYFSTLGIRLLAGREFEEGDLRESERQDTGTAALRSRVAIVSATTARRLFPGRLAVGQRFSRGERYRANESYEVVGVVEDARYHGLREAPEGMIYFASAGGRSTTTRLVVRSTGRPEEIVAAVRRQVAAVDPAIPVMDVRPLVAQVAHTLSMERLLAALCIAFGAVATLLAAIGLYGVLAEGVLRRQRELGIRLALGETRAGIVRSVLNNALTLILAGTLIGGVAALVLARMVTHFLYGIAPTDPWTLVAAAALLVAIGFAAATIPARRAVSVDPIMLLRHE
ncbi:MAG: ADOP family duplicated permease [Longimicrobiales bacterium]